MIRVGKGTPQYRAIAVVSMGGYGAMNIGLSHADLFKTMACLGGPLDMARLLKHIEIDLLGNYDNPSVYPNRDTLIDMLQDLSISFGNPVYYNPQSTYFPPGITSENARKPTTLLNFKDREDNPNGSSGHYHEDPPR
jgi:S-formylglutathione hydrolase FrmB